MAAACGITAFHVPVTLVQMQCFSSPAGALFGRCIRLSLFSTNIHGFVLTKYFDKIQHPRVYPTVGTV